MLLNPRSLRVLITLALLQASIAYGKDSLFTTISAYPIGENQRQIGVHGEYFRSKNLAGLSLDENLYIFPTVTATIGLGKNGEIWIQHEAFRSIDDNQQDIHITDGGDPSFFTKLRLAKEHATRPEISVIYGVKEPATNVPLGSDEADFFLFLAHSKTFDHSSLHFNFGIGILGNKNKSQNQDHTISYGLHGKQALGNHYQLGYEITGQYKVSGAWYEFWAPTSAPINRASLGLGAYYAIDKNNRLGIKLSTGLINESESFGLLIGFDRRFGVSEED
ncbi:MAG: hypothetical protein KOO60_05015 [Gemmatimonadales bacterium]|nr:hypothetical protein [Gemmatimonadales bacterium]